jgi:hypothetical protein
VKNYSIFFYSIGRTILCMTQWYSAKAVAGHRSSERGDLNKVHMGFLRPPYAGVKT